MSCHAIGALRWFSSSGWPCRANPLIVRCSIACELSDLCGSFETFLTQSRHTSSNCFSLGQLYWNTSVKLVALMSRPNVSRSLAQAHAPVFVLSSRTITLARPAVFAASTAYSTLSVSCRICDDICCDLCCRLVLGTSKDLQHSRCCVAFLS